MLKGFFLRLLLLIFFHFTIIYFSIFFHTERDLHLTIEKIKTQCFNDKIADELILTADFTIKIKNMETFRRILHT